MSVWNDPLVTSDLVLSAVEYVAGRLPAHELAILRGPGPHGYRDAFWTIVEREIRERLRSMDALRTRPDALDAACCRAYEAGAEEARSGVFLDRPWKTPGRQAFALGWLSEADPHDPTLLWSRQEAELVAHDGAGAQ